MVGTNDNPLQIDEARFTGRQKYNRGILLNGDKSPLSEDSDAEQRNNRNYGGRIDGPSVFGLKQGSDCQYFRMEWPDGNTLILIIERECKKDSVIHSDVWPAYSNLNAIGYHHLTVNY